jgi:ankyrin repeat protein
LEKGADINAKNDKGKMPLHGACFYGHKAVIALPLEKGTVVNVK